MSQWSTESFAMAVSGMKNHPLNQKMYIKVENSPTSMPAIAPYRFMRLLNMPIMSAGKIEDAARPKASATTWAAKPGGFSPR